MLHNKTRQILTLLHNRKDLFYFYSLSAVHSHDLYNIHFRSFSSYNWYKLNSHSTCFRRGFIAQSVEHRTGIAKVVGLNPVGDSEFFLGFICNYLSYLATVKISFNSILYLQFTHMIFIIYTRQDKVKQDTTE